MKEEKIKQIINDFLHEEFEVDRTKLVPSANLKSTLELDSLDYIDLVVVMEKNLHLKRTQLTWWIFIVFRICIIM
jgi:acyl carrier protein